MSLTGNVEAEVFRQFISSVTDYAIYLLSPEGIIRSWNAGAERFKGYQADEVIGRHFSLFYTDADRALGLPARALGIARDTGKFEDEGWRVRKDGTRFWASVVLDPIRNEDGELLGFTKITRDITERRDTAAALHASEERFRLLVQGVTDYAIYMLSTDGIVTNWNEGAKRIKGLDSTEAIGTHFQRFYTPEDRAAGMPAKALDTAAREGKYEHEGWRVRADGTRFYAHIVIDPIRNSEGELVGFAKITRDITERREAALALERTKEALFQSQKMEAIGKLTGGVAHDFNNLLNVIASGIDLLRLASRPEDQRRTLDSMERAAQRGATLTQQLLAFARQQPLQASAEDLNRVISSFEAVLRRAVTSNIHLDIIKGDVAPIRIDAAQLEAAALNLIVNARDAIGPEHAGRITLETTLVELGQGEAGRLAPGRYVRLTVRDNGCGMTEDTKARAVEPFFTTKPVGKGTGLGLSQVYGLVQQSGGDLVIESAPEQGTAIHLVFPALAEDSETQEASEGLTEKVLVVDDQPDVLDMSVALFQNLGFEVLSANSGYEALELLARHSDITLMFSDIVMPGMNGIALATAARERNPQIKVILASGYLASSLRDEFGEQLASFPTLTKPYRLPDLVKTLRKLGR